MKQLIISTSFLTGTFCGFSFTMLAFTFVLTQLYTSNELLSHSGFYKDGKLFRVIEAAKLRCYK